MRTADLPVPQDPERARDAVERILARPQFADDRSWLERGQAWFSDQLARLLEAVASGDDALLGWVLVAILLVVVGAVAARVARGIRADPGPPGEAVPGPRLSVVDWHARADAHQAAGERRLALRCLYRALVADLADRGLVEEVPGRTAGEQRQSVARAAPSAEGVFGEATARFERAWYGSRPPSEDDLEGFRDLARQVLERAVPGDVAEAGAR